MIKDINYLEICITWYVVQLQKWFICMLFYMYYVAHHLLISEKKLIVDMHGILHAD